MPALLRAAAPPGTPAAATAVVETERVLASVLEAVIGACYLCAGFERTAAAVVEAFAEQIDEALDEPGRLQVGAAGAARASRRDGRLRGHRAARAAARPHLHGRGARRRGDRRARLRPQQEARRAGRGAPCARARPRPARTRRRRRSERAVHLKSITIKGFKSFPDRTRLQFGEGVSVIVGPNGSGKSNITDAVLWALGEQSPLAVRGQSMQDVIFAGGRGVQARSRGRGRARARQHRRRRRDRAQRDLDHAPAGPRRARASTASTARAAGSSTCSSCCRTRASARRRTPSSRRAASSRS